METPARARWPSHAVDVTEAAKPQDQDPVDASLQALRLKRLRIRAEPLRLGLGEVASPATEPHEE